MRSWPAIGNGKSIRPSHITTLQSAVDEIEGGVSVTKTASGSTGDRPDATILGAGAMWFDATIGAPIWSDGSIWVLSDGTAA